MFARVVAVVFALALMVAPLPSASHAAPSRVRLLSAEDRQIGFSVSRLAEHHPAAAVRRLRTRAAVSWAGLGPDGRTIQVSFRDGASLVIFPRITQPGRPQIPLTHLRALARVRQAAGQPVKAVVLEPFANVLGLGPEAGQPVVDLLTKAGFAVDVFRNDQVTVPLMEQLSQYAVVYILTHSSLLGSGHALILLGETDQGSYPLMSAECTSLQPRLCSLQDGIAAGDLHKLWIGITDLFVQLHMGEFPKDSIVFLNGCSIMAAPAFVSAWHGQNVASLLGWDNYVDSNLTEPSAQLFFQDMDSGLTVDAALQDVSAKGLGTSTIDNQTSHLKQSGYGSDTLLQAVGGPTATPTASPTPSVTPIASPTPTTTPTASPTPTVTPTSSPTPRPTAKPTAKPSKSCPKNSKKKHGKCLCKKGYTMKKGKCVKKK